MFIINTDEIIPVLRTRLHDYLILKGVKEPNEKAFCCFIHNENTPSMAMNPKTGFQTAHCFGCNTTADIFKAAAVLDNLPESGSEWMTQTIPTLAELLNVPIQYGEPSTHDREKLKHFKLAQDIADIIESDTYVNQDYAKTRNWTNEYETIGTISEETLVQQLLNRGWSSTDLITIPIIKTSSTSFFGEDKATFTIRDPRGRPCGFISRNLADTGPKYLNTTESIIFEKRKTLLGLDKAIKSAKYNGLYIVEGPGDRAQLLRLGITNVVAVMGTAFTVDHIHLLKMYGIKDVFLSLDWDQAGLLATARIFKEALRSAPGINCWVVEPPDDMGENTDPDAYAFNKTDLQCFTNLPKTSAFEWVMKNISENDSVNTVCERMIPIIASETTAVHREILIQKLQAFTGISYQAIATDVSAVRDKKFEERRNRLLAAAEKYKTEVERDPDNLLAAMSQHESDIVNIERDYERDLIGTEYQVSRLDAINEMKKPNADGVDRTTFKMKYYKDFIAALSGGMNLTTGTLIYLGGRANCFAKDTLFTNPHTGEKVQADQLATVHSIDPKTHQASIQQVTDYIDSGVQKCFEVTNALGLQVTTTANHRYLTPYGWKRLSQLKVGDRVAAPRTLNIHDPTNQFTIQEAEFIGLMLGDGNITQARPLFTNCDPAINKHIDKLVIDIFGQNIKVSNYSVNDTTRHPTYRMVGFVQKDWKTNRTKGGQSHPNPVTVYFKKLKLHGKRAWEKSIPKDLLVTNKSIIAGVLRGLFSSDGTVTKSTIEISLTSKQMIADIKTCLHRLGIGYSYRERDHTKSHWRRRYEIKIKSKQDIIRFQNSVGFIGEKQARMSHLDTIRYQKPDTRFDSEDVRWTKIVSIIPVGFKETCDITVANTHSFCLPGYVLHNSGKTATGTGVAMDIALHDPDSIVVAHFTDDSLALIEPRMLTIISKMINSHQKQELSIGMAANPHNNIHTPEHWALYNQATIKLRELLAKEKLILIDSENGATLSTVERHLKYARRKHPSKKVFLFCDKVLSPSNSNIGCQKSVNCWKPLKLNTPLLDLKIPPMAAKAEKSIKMIQDQKSYESLAMGNQQPSFTM